MNEIPRGDYFNPGGPTRGGQFHVLLPLLVRLIPD